jgi:cyanophycinase
MINPRGILIAIGGAEDKGSDVERGALVHSNLNYIELGILRRIVKEAGGPNARIEVVTTASIIPLEVAGIYLQAFERIGCTNIGLMDIRDRKDAANPEYLSRLQECDAVLLSGGNQLRLTATFGGTTFLQILQERYLTDEFVIAGTSAGAMAMSTTMIYHGESSHAHLKGEVKLISGLGLMPNVIIDSHFEKRGRFGRLSQAVGANPSAIGIGLGEDTGMIITDGNRMEAIGSGLVVIIDGHNIRHTNIADIPVGNPISIEHLVVHICTKGNGYYVKERNFVEQISHETIPVFANIDLNK